MLAIDTNVVVRYVTRDDAAQSRKARVLVDENDVFVSVTVMLEKASIRHPEVRAKRASKDDGPDHGRSTSAVVVRDAAFGGSSP